MTISRIGISLKDTVNGLKKFYGKSSVLAVQLPVTNFRGLQYSHNLTSDNLSITTAEGVFGKYKHKLKELVKDKNGNFVYRNSDKTELVEIPKGKENLYDSYVELSNGKKYYEKVVGKGDELRLNIEKDFKPLNEETGILIHGTSEEAYNKILKEGFRKSKRFAETFDGIYFTRLADGENHYGEKQIKCLLNGKVAVGDINKISDFIYAPTAIEDFLSAHNISGIDATEIKQLLLKEEFLDKGYKALYSANSNNLARCKSLVVFNPKDVKIIKD